MQQNTPNCHLTGGLDNSIYVFVHASTTSVTWCASPRFPQNPRWRLHIFLGGFAPSFFIFVDLCSELTVSLVTSLLAKAELTANTSVSASVQTCGPFPRVFQTSFSLCLGLAGRRRAIGRRHAPQSRLHTPESRHLEHAKSIQGAASCTHCRRQRGQRGGVEQRWLRKAVPRAQQRKNVGR